MDLAAPLKSDVLQPLLVWLVPGAVLVAPYLLIVGVTYVDVGTIARDYPALVTVFCFFVALAAGVALESIGTIVEAYIWDRLLERETGWHDAIWYEYLKLAPTREPIGQRFLRNVLVGMKFQLSFSLALIMSWLGWMWADVRLDLLAPSWHWPFSLGMLFIAGFLLWESGRKALVLGQVRSLIVAGCVPPTLMACDEPPAAARKLDGTLRYGGWVGVLGGLTLLVGLRILEGGFRTESGYTAAVLLSAFGVVMLSASRTQEGRCRIVAQRLCVASGGAAALLLIRVITTQTTVANLTGAVVFAGMSGWWYWLMSQFKDEKREPRFEPCTDVWEQRSAADAQSKYPTPGP